MEIAEKDAIKAVRWIVRHKRTEYGLTPPQYFINIAKKYFWVYNGYVYRGLRLYDWDNKYEEILKKNIGDKIEYESAEDDSWTTSKDVAIAFSAGTDLFFLSRDTMKGSAKFFGVQGIVIKGMVKDGLDIDKALSDLETMGRTNQNVDDELEEMPWSGSEGEVIGQSVGLVEIVNKINC